LEKRAITALIATWNGTGFGHENHVGARSEERLRADDRHRARRASATCLGLQAEARVELEQIIATLQAKISPATLFRPV
jgi:hypothetical protein